MPSKLQLYSQMAEDASRKITGTYQGWTDFLRTAGRLYKYPYHEQLMIHAQRPDATACAEYDVWNQKMGRYVRRGSHGIVLIDTSGDHPRLRYVFDVADTAERERSRRPNLWELRQEHSESVREALYNHFEVGGITLADQLEETARWIVDDYWHDHREDILGIVDGSYIGDYDDEETIQNTFCEAATVSVGYVLLSRCDLEPEERYEPVDFMQVFDFNTPQTVSALGCCVSTCSETILRQVEVAIRKYERTQSQSEKAAERTTEHEQPDLHEERRLSDPRPESAGTGTPVTGQIRETEENLSEGTQTPAVESDDPVRGSVSASVGDRPDSEQPAGADDSPDDGGSRSDGAAESKGSHEVGADDELHQSTGRGSDSQRTSLQLSLFPSEADQIAIVDETERDDSHSVFSMPISQADIDDLLRLGGNADHARKTIVVQFSKGKSAEENADFLQSLFHGGNGIITENGRYAAWYSEDGIHVAPGGSVQHLPSATVIPWEDAAIRIDELLEAGTYATNVEVQEASLYEHTQIAQSLWYLHSDLSEQARNQGLLGFMDAFQGGGFPDETARIAEALTDPLNQEWLQKDLSAFIQEYRQHPEVLRFRNHRPEDLLKNIQELSLPRREYAWSYAQLPEIRQFITEDEIAEALTHGSGVAGGMDRIYAFFTADHTINEQVDFLKTEYGIGGRSHAVSSSSRSSEDHSGKGIRLKKGDCPEVQMSWNQVAKRISDLIRQDRYLSTASQETRLDEKEDPIPAENTEAVTELTDDQITDLAIQRWNGNMDSKRAVVRYMEDHAREKDTAQWLRAEFGQDLAAFPIGDTGTNLSWPKVQRRIAKMIREDRFFTEEEQDNWEHIDPVAIRERLDSGESRRFVEGVLAQAEADANQAQQIISALSPDHQLLVHAMEVAGFAYNPLSGFDSQQVFQTPSGYPLSFASWDEVYEWINTAELKDEPGLRDKVQAVLHPAQDQVPSYQVGDTVYLEGDPYTITEISDNQVEMLPPGLIYPVYRLESKETFERLLIQDDRNSSDTSLPEEKTPVTISPVSEVPAENFRITDDHLGEGGPKTKFIDNIRAIQLLKQLEQDNRQAAPDEQEILSRYVGWGGLADAFDPEKENWASEYQELKEALTPAEYEAARGSTLNAHYTSPTIIRGIYEAIENMGFRTGNILEPSCGVGNFFGLLPDSMAGSKLYGVELDSISGRIAQKLYPDADITVAGFETTDRRDFYDLVVGNVPFGQYQVDDKAYNKLGFNIHNYFAAKALDQVRPGGVVAIVTSRFTMDAKDSTVRRYLAQRADLLGAIRLPNDAFKKNAGAEVVSDILFLQKRDRPMDLIPDWTQTEANEDGYAVNRYFLDHPEMVLGIATEQTGAHGKEYTVAPIPDADLAQQLHVAMENLHGSYQESELPELGESASIDNSIPADPTVKNYSYTVVDGDVYFCENSRMVQPNLNATAKERVKGMVELRDCVHHLIDQQLDGYVTDAEIQATQAELNTLYDTYTKQYGLINSRANALAFSDDSSYYLLSSLEVLDEDHSLERKADMFTKRTIRPHEAVTSVDTASEALALSISEKACVDMEYMSSLTGKTEQELFSDLRGVIFMDMDRKPDGSYTYRTADDFLSGNVREKLSYYTKALDYTQGTEKYNAMLDNVEALRQAQPKDLDASEIEVRLGATWINQEYIKQFMFELLETPFYLKRSMDVIFSPFTAEWNIKGKNNVSYNDISSRVTYGTERVNAYKILEETLNLRDIRVYDSVTDVDGKERRVLNSKETTLAQQKQQSIKEAFQDWIWKDPERRQELVSKYNEMYNSTRPREYDGSHIVFSGMNPEIKLREHQLNAVAHILYGGNTLLAHQVGAGKTFEMTAAAMESKRLGLCQKALFAVPNHLTEQWAAEFLRLYPSANILVATKKDFEPKNRKRFCARIATGDYDAVIIGHSQFEKIPVSQERQQRLLNEQIAEIEDGLQELRNSGAERFSVKSLERTKKSLEAKLKKLTDSERKDDVVTFEQLGVDRLYVDEAHSFKNLFLYTKMRNVAGLSTSDAQKSSDMLMKCRYMDEITGGKGVVFATGTPVSNSMTELYTMMRYLQNSTLRKRGLSHFDCWASTFGETSTAIELAPEGTGYRARTRFSKFFNLPELMTLFKEIADIKTSDQLHLPTPEPVYHTEVAQPTEIQQSMVQELSERAATVHSGSIDPSQDNMLKITSDGRKLGLDQRVVNPDLPDEPGSKVNTCVRNIVRIYEEGQDEKLTQLVFCDLSTPKIVSAPKAAKASAGNLDNPELHALQSATGEETESPFTVYEDIRSKLVACGIPRNEIAFIHEANTEVRKKELYAKMRTGQVRVLIGSTSKMGAGMNVQDRLVALHDLDCPWRPGDLEQRSGRIIRQGNHNKQVHIYRYVTEGTFDAYLWQTVENKQKFISQIMTSKSPVRSCDDVDETALSFAEIKALCAGDPRIKEKMDLDVDVARLKLMKANHQSQQYRLEDNILKVFPQQIEQNKGFVAGFQADLATLAGHPHPENGFAGMTVKEDVLVDKDNAGAALLEAFKDVKGMEPVPIGSYRGFQMSLTLEDFGRDYILTLKGQMTHRVLLGKDARGNLTRIDNVLDAMSSRLTAVQNQLDNLYAQMDSAKAELGKPFPQEQELHDKSMRLAELNAVLNIDEKTPIEVMAEDAGKEKASVLGKLKNLSAQSHLGQKRISEREER